MEKAKHKIHFDNLTPLYPDERIGLEIDDQRLKISHQELLTWSHQLEKVKDR